MKCVSRCYENFRREPGCPIRKEGNAELEHIRTQVMIMGGMVEQQLTDAITAMHNLDGELAQRV
ncbi:hypothetical protein HZD82_22830, partial [Pantoea agglomerans]|nr:hypothetical protein [Pantoea agglomerans]